MNRHRHFAILLLLLLVGWVALLGHSRLRAQRWRNQQLPQLRALAGQLTLTDLALWSEARYTRHPSQADLFTPFQDFPGAPEHFPAGSIVGPQALRRSQQQAGDRPR